MKIIPRLGENRNPATGLQVANNLSFVTRLIAHDGCANNFKSYGRRLIFVPIICGNLLQVARAVHWSLAAALIVKRQSVQFFSR